MNRFVLIGSTNACNCKCFYCPVVHAIKPEGAAVLTTEELIDTIDQVAAVTQPKKYHDTILGFVGGEPLVRKDWAELVEHSNKKGFFTQIFSNGILIDKAMAKNLKKAKLGCVTLTFDSVDAGEFDKIKGEGSFSKTIDAVKYLKEYKIPVVWSTHFSTDSIESGTIIASIEKAKEFKADLFNLFEFIHFNTTKNKDNTNTFTATGLDEKDMQELQNQLKPYYHLKSPTFPAIGSKPITLFSYLFNTYEKADWINFENNFRYDNKLNTFVGNCHVVSKTLFCITWFGDVQACIGNNFSFGNIKERPLKESLDYMQNHEIFDISLGENQIYKHNKFGFNLPKGCFSKTEAMVIEKVPKYNKLFNNQVEKGKPIRVDKIVE
jgi:MoaA/NifB/PqqE/SkfB family radical SAM enzyme